MNPRIDKIIKMMHQLGKNEYTMDHDEAKSYGIDIPKGAKATITTDFVSGGKIDVTSPGIPFSEEMKKLAEKPIAVKNPLKGMGGFNPFKTMKNKINPKKNSVLGDQQKEDVDLLYENLKKTL